MNEMPEFTFIYQRRSKTKLKKTGKSTVLSDETLLFIFFSAAPNEV